MIEAVLDRAGEAVPLDARSAMRSASPTRSPASSTLSAKRSWTSRLTRARSSGSNVEPWLPPRPAKPRRQAEARRNGGAPTGGRESGSLNLHVRFVHGSSYGGGDRGTAGCSHGTAVCHLTSISEGARYSQGSFYVRGHRRVLETNRFGELLGQKQMRLAIRYFRATFVASALSALPLLVAFAADQGQGLVGVLSAWPFFSVANFFAIGTLGWLVGWIFRLHSATPVMVLGAIFAGLGWYAYGALLLLGVHVFEQILWGLMGAASGMIAGRLLVKIGFDADVHKEQIVQERKGQEQNYRGFLSYSRHDEPRALTVWRFLDEYRTPKQSIGSPGDFGPVPCDPRNLSRSRRARLGSGG